MPVKAMSPALTTVTAAWAMRALSTLEKANTVTIPAGLTGAVVEEGAAAGTAAGAVYVPVVWSIEPQSLLPLLQEALPVFAVDSKVPRVAVAGLSAMRIPESKTMVNVPVFFLSALEVAVIVTMTLGNVFWFGKSFGARNVAVEGTVVLVLATGVSVPTAGVPASGSPMGILAVSQAAEADGFGFGVAVVGFGVVV